MLSQAFRSTGTEQLKSEVYAEVSRIPYFSSLFFAAYANCTQQRWAINCRPPPYVTTTRLDELGMQSNAMAIGIGEISINTDHIASKSKDAIQLNHTTAHSNKTVLGVCKVGRQSNTIASNMQTRDDYFQIRRSPAE